MPDFVKSVVKPFLALRKIPDINPYIFATSKF